MTDESPRRPLDHLTWRVGGSAEQAGDDAATALEEFGTRRPSRSSDHLGESERELCLRLLGRVNRAGPLTVLGDKGYAGAEFEAQAATLGATVVRPRRKVEPDGGLGFAPLRQRIESIYWTAKDILALGRHGARTLRGLRARIASRSLALAAAISLNYELERPSRALVDYVA